MFHGIEKNATQYEFLIVSCFEKIKYIYYFCVFSLFDICVLKQL